MTGNRSQDKRRTRFALTIAATVKNEACYIEEWLAYHTVVGVEHFFIYDNESTDGLHDMLTPYVNHGLVTLLVWPLDRGQASAYKHAAHFFGESTRWLAVIDIDEFIVPRCDPDVITILERIDPEQMVMPWRMFGFSGHRCRPAGFVTENFTVAQDLPGDGLPFIAAKSIVKPDTLTGVAIHLHRTQGNVLVDASGGPVEADATRVLDPDYSLLQLNHYYTKSEEEFAAKVARGPGSGSPTKTLFGIADEVGYNTRDTEIARFVEPTKRRLADLRALSPKPFRYGSQVGIGRLHHDPFKSHAQRAISNHMHRIEIPKNSSPPVEDLGHRVRSSVVPSPPVDPDGMGAFLESVHVHDFVRRLGATWISSCHGHDTAASADQLVLNAGDPTLRRHLAVVAVLETSTATKVTWAPRSSESDDKLTTELPHAGQYFCIAQITAAPIRADAVDIAIVSESPCRFREIAILSYG